MSFSLLGKITLRILFFIFSKIFFFKEPKNLRGVKTNYPRNPTASHVSYALISFTQFPRDLQFIFSPFPHWAWLMWNHSKPCRFVCSDVPIQTMTPWCLCCTLPLETHMMGWDHRRVAPFLRTGTLVKCGHNCLPPAVSSVGPLISA